MKEEDNSEAKVTQDERNYKQKARCRFMRKQKNGISPWKNTGKLKKRLQSKEKSQESLKETKERAPTLSCQETSKSVENSAEDFNTEWTIFNDLFFSSDVAPCNEFIPYYRTYSNLVEIPLQVNIELSHENAEGEEVQSDGCVFNPKYEDEPLRDVSLTMGYFPYYRTYEEYFGSSDLPSEIHSGAESEGSVANNAEEIKSEISCETEEVSEGPDIQENCETSEDTSQCSESLQFTENQVLTDSIVESCDSDLSLFDEILNLRQSPSDSGYFPYYRTYGKLLLGPEASSNALCSSRDALEMFGMESEGTLQETRDNDNGCSVC
ncbi:uncharacterized protein LOC128409602 [Podarcis raffonei]|uniref:uncharacterized protein LOC128409602 n=1 Tax=Podarcis raffonei TaxID=65483 RepID=UPI0023290E53|nr:uncharacterized protein LOC128409602 [Podarcis raffonei]